MPPHPLSVAVVRALDGLVDDGALPWHGARPDAEEADDAHVTRDGDRYATSLPMRVTGRTVVDAPALAELLVARLREDGDVRSARVSGAGYVELDPDPAALVRLALAPDVRVDDAGHGALDPLAGSGSTAGVCHAVAEVGADAVRFALARRTTDRAPDRATLDLDVLGRADERNPVHSVQLAHARLAGVLRQGAALGLAPAEAEEVDAGLLGERPDRRLAAAVVGLRPAAARAVRLRRPDLLARQLSLTAEAAHDHLSSCRVLPTGDEAPDGRHRARLRLVLAARDALAHGLDLLGVTAPERI